MSFEAVVLGIAQDGGVPHPGCACATCEARANGRAPRLHVACLGLTDGTRHALVDATPDLPAQLRLLGAARPDALFLTHAHMGHVAGLLYLGREALAVRDVPVHGTAAMQRHLRGNAPWRELETQGHVRYADAGRTEFGDLVVEALPVPHRAEHTDTVAYRIRGPRGALLYVPDIDAWDAWDHDVRALVASVDVALLDATFFAPEELPHRDPREVPHPFVTDTLARLDGLGARVRLIHLNHTNRLLADETPARSRGFAVAREGERFAL